MLNPAQKQRILKAALELRRRRNEERLRYFVPTQPPQNDQYGFLYSHAKIRAVFGGNRSGKTEIGVADSCMFMLGRHPVRTEFRRPPVFVRYCAPKYEDGIKAVILKKFREMVPHHELQGGTWKTAWSEKARTLAFANKSTCRFFSYEQDVNVYGGADIDGFYMDEHGPEAYFIENMMRTVDRDGFGVLTMTPEAGITWEEEKIVEASKNDPDIDFWFFTTYNNPYLSKEGVESVVKMITDEKLRDAKLMGRFVALSGMVYPQFDAAIHVIPDRELPKRGHRQCLIDPHHRTPTAILWRYISPDGVSFVYREAEFPPASGGVKEMAEFIRTKSAGDYIQQWIADEAMGGDGLNVYGEDSVIRQLQSFGIPVVGTNQDSNKAFSAGVSALRSKLNPDPVTKKPAHYIFKSCNGTARQYQNYQYRKHTAVDEELLREHVRNINDHYVTLDRYGVMAEPTLGNVRVTSRLTENWA